MASRLASGGINLAGRTSSRDVGAAAGPDVNYRRTRDVGGSDEQRATAVWLLPGSTRRTVIWCAVAKAQRPSLIEQRCSLSLIAQHKWRSES